MSVCTSLLLQVLANIRLIGQDLRESLIGLEMHNFIQFLLILNDLLH